MNATQTPQTFARTITVCAECDVEVLFVRGAVAGRWSLAPCGHYASLKVKDNPLCPAA